MRDEQSTTPATTKQGTWFQPASVICGIVIGVAFCISVMRITGKFERRQLLSVTNSTDQPVELRGVTITPGGTGAYSLPDNTLLKSSGTWLATFTRKGRTAELKKDASGRLVLQFTDE